MIELVGLPVFSGSARVAVVRAGSIDGQPVNAAACCLCWAASYDRQTVSDAACWIRDHLSSTHGMVSLIVDLRRGPTTHRLKRDRFARRTVARIGKAWGGEACGSTVAAWRRQPKAA